jgi:SAM-dependent methyltransferase
VVNSELFDNHAATYKQEVDRSISFTRIRSDYFTRVKAHYIEDICTEHFRPRKIQSLDVLDIGCGVGANHGQLAPKFHALCGVDVSAASLAQARAARSDVRYQVYDGIALPFPAESFDTDYAICVLHHVAPSEWRRFAEEMRRVVRPGGLALVFEHNPRNPLTLKAVNNCAFDADAVLLRPEVARDLYLGAGFAEAEVRHILAVPAASTWMRNADRLFAQLPFGAQYYVRAVR